MRIKKNSILKVWLCTSLIATPTVLITSCSDNRLKIQSIGFTDTCLPYVSGAYISFRIVANENNLANKLHISISNDDIAYRAIMNIQIVKYQDNVIDGMLVLNQALPGPDLSHNILFHFDCYANKKLLSTRDFYVVPLPELNLSISDGSFPLDNDQSATITAIVDNPCGFGFKWLVDNLPSWLNVSYSQWGDEVVLSNLNTNFNDFMPFISKLHCHYGIYSSAEIDISCLNTHGKTFVPLDNFNINTQGIITGFKTGSQEITQTLLVIPTKVSDIDVSGIDANAFTGTKMINIKQLIFNDNSSIGTIGQSSFDGDPLESIYFSSSINSIASNAFANCTSLNTLEFTTNSPPNFGSNCFQNDTAITSIWIPKGSTNNYLPYLNIFGGATNPGILKERSI